MPTKPPANTPSAPSDEEKALVKSFKKRIDSAIEVNEKRFKKFETWRLQYEGFTAGKRDSEKTRTNLIFSTLQVILPRVYAKNPEIAISPGEAVSDDQYETYKNFCKTSQVTLDKLFVRGAELKRRAKAAVRSAMITSIGWVKLTLQKDYGTDPIIQQRLNDAQENLKNVDSLHRQLQEDGSTVDKDLLNAKLQAEIQSLMSQVEVVTRKGFVLEKLLSEDVMILDESVIDYDGYKDAKAIAQRIWFTKEDFEKTFGYSPDSSDVQGMAGKRYSAPRGVEGLSKVPKEANVSSQPGKKGSTPITEESGAWFCVYEIWNKEQNNVLTWCEGMDGWCRAPYNPKVGDHWYSFFPLEFNVVDGCFYGLSDVELLFKLQEEYTTTRDDLAKHREENLPVRVAREGGNLTNDDLNAIKNRKSGDILVIKGGGGQPLSNDLMVMDNPAIDPRNYDTTPIMSDIERVAGSSDAAGGTVQKAKTATEAEYLAQGLASRTTERQDSVEDWFAQMAIYALEIALDNWSVEEIQKIAGRDAVWPQMDSGVLMDQVNIEVRAGSSGKPDQHKDREQWSEMLPLLKENMQAVMELRASGQQDLAEALVELTKETFRRFDERIDVDQYFPRKTEGDPEAELMKCQQALQQLQAEHQMMQEEFDKVSKQEYSKAASEAAKVEAERTKQSEIASKEAIEGAKTNSQAVMARDKLDQEAAIAKAQLDAENAKEAAKIASQERIKLAEINANIALQKELALIKREGDLAIAKDKMALDRANEQDRTQTDERIAQHAANAQVAVAAEKIPAGTKNKPMEIPGLMEMAKAMQEIVKSVQQGNEKNAKAIADGLAKVAEASMMERELLLDDKGEPVGSRVRH